MKYNKEDLLKLYQKNIGKNNSKTKKSLRLLFSFLIKWIGIFLCIWLVIACISEVKEYKEVFFTFNAMEQLKNMYKGNFKLLFPEIDISEENSTPDRFIPF